MEGKVERYLPHTSIGGQCLGFEMYRSRGKKKNKAEKGKRKKTRKERNTFTATRGCKFWVFLLENWGKNEIFD